MSHTSHELLQQSLTYLVVIFLQYSFARLQEKPINDPCNTVTGDHLCLVTIMCLQVTETASLKCLPILNK